MKTEVDVIDAVPSKRLYLSIIADYDLNRAMCELVDNVLDIWYLRGRHSRLVIKIDMSPDQQTIRVEDNAGGVEEEYLKVLVSPGETNIDPHNPTIGIFGVGSKRAVVALAEQVKISTRAEGGKQSFQVEYGDQWLQSDDWKLPYYEIDSIEEGTTVIELVKLRSKLDDNRLAELKRHLGATYAFFLNNRRISIKLNDESVPPIDFGNWAYPPRFQPRRYSGTLESEDGGSVSVEIVAGLTSVSSPSGEYGLYLYCNNRLIAEALKDASVGFAKGQVGHPHSSISLVRMLVRLNGPATSMPWNSSKSGINPSHPTFVALRGFLVQVLKDWASLSRRWVGEWQTQVFDHADGRIIGVKVPDFPLAKKSYLPELPVSRPRLPDRLREINKGIVKQKPWTRGLHDSVAVADMIFNRQRLDEKNRICLIILDSTLEIAFKEFLVNESNKYYTDGEIVRIFSKRHLVHEEIKKYNRIRRDFWKRIVYFYNLRCELVHKRTTVSISDDQIEEFKEIVEYALKKLFGLKFEQ